MKCMLNKININTKTSNIPNDCDTIRLQNSFYREFLEKGKDYTEGYLSAFGTIRIFFARNFLTNEGCRYNGAKRALEDMTSRSKLEKSV